MRDVRLLGVGLTSFSREGRTGQLANEAIDAALADAGLSSRDVGAVAVATDDANGDATDLLRDGRARGLRPVCASGGAALHVGWWAVASGAHDVALCVGYQGARPAGERAAPLQQLAAEAERYMAASGATEEHFARVAAKNRAHGAANPRALLRVPVDAAAVLASDLLVWPLHRLMVAQPSEGAAAVVLAGARAPRVRASMLVREGDDDVVAGAARAARRAYEAAGLGPDDVDCAEIDAPTAPRELAAYEALQFAPDGQGPELVDSGFTALGGVLPVNTSGGALAQGDATAAAGLAQLCELAWQLRGEAGRRQVAGARVGLALAGPLAEHPARVVSLTILSTG